MYCCISTEPYDRIKDEGTESKLEWTNVALDERGLKNYLSEGYAICHAVHYNGDGTFDNSFRKKENLFSADFIALDIDAVKPTAGEFFGKMIGTLYQPTLLYTTANDGKVKYDKYGNPKPAKYLNRFRAIIVLNKPICDPEDYTKVVKELKKAISKIIDDPKDFGEFTDANGKRGIYKGIRNDNSDIAAVHFFAGNKDGLFFPMGPITDLDALCHNLGVKLSASQPKEWCEPAEDEYKDFMKAYGNPELDFRRLVKKYEGQFEPLRYNNNDTEYIDNGGHKLYYKTTDKQNSLPPINVYRTVANEVQRKYYCNGEHRKNHIWARLIGIKYFNQNATLAQLLWEATLFVNACIDFEDEKEPITKTYVKNTAKYVFGMAYEDIVREYTDRYFKENHNEIIVNKEECARRNLFPVKQWGLLASHEYRHDRKVERDAEISRLFDPVKTDKENVCYMLANGIVDMTMNILRDWKKEHGYNRTKKQAKEELFEQYYDNTLTNKQNVALLLQAGCETSLTAWKRWKRGVVQKVSYCTNTRERERISIITEKMDHPEQPNQVEFVGVTTPPKNDTNNPTTKLYPGITEHSQIVSEPQGSVLRAFLPLTNTTCRLGV